jgi:hypothetical protein
MRGVQNRTFPIFPRGFVMPRTVYGDYAKWLQSGQNKRASSNYQQAKKGLAKLKELGL